MDGIRGLRILLLLVLCGLFSQAAKAQDIDFTLKLHRQMAEMLIGLQQESKGRDLSEFRIDQLLRERSQKILLEVTRRQSFGQESGPIDQARENVQEVVKQVAWRSLVRAIFRQVENVQNVAAKGGIIMGSVLMLHVIAHFAVPAYYTFVEGRADLGSAIFAWPAIGQGTILGVLLQKFFDRGRLDQIYGKENFARLQEFQKENRTQLALSGIRDVLLPLTGRFKKLTIALQRFGLVNRIRSFVAPSETSLNWGQVKAYFKDEKATEAVLEVVSEQRDLSSEAKAAVFLSYLEDHEPQLLLKLLADRRHLTTDADLLPGSVLADLEAWAVGLKGLKTEMEVFRVLAQAPKHLPSFYVWQIWKTLGISEFLDNNRTMNLTQRRAWVLAAEEMHGAAWREPSRNFHSSEVTTYLQAVSQQTRNLRKGPLVWGLRACFSPLLKLRDLIEKPRDQALVSAKTVSSP